MSGDDSLPTWVLVLAVLLWAALQYGLAGWALRDLWRRPRVRGGNKTIWVFVILAVPIVGALVYATYGPASFLPRPPRPAPPPAPPEVDGRRPSEIDPAA